MHLFNSFLDEEIDDAHEKGLAEGRAEGRAEGLEEGLEKGAQLSVLRCIDQLMQHTNVSLEEACKILSIPLDQYYEMKSVHQQ